MTSELTNIPSLIGFLKDWYDFESLSAAGVKGEGLESAPKILNDFWKCLGMLFQGHDRWMKDGTPGPLAAQDALISSDYFLPKDGFVPLVFENQGCWAHFMKDDDISNDPDVYSNWLADAEGIYENVPMGCKLSELIITSALTETIMFAETGSVILDQNCNLLIWSGRYYSAEGVKPEYDAPSHYIFSNANHTKLALFFGKEYSGFTVDRFVGRDRLRSHPDLN